MVGAPLPESMDGVSTSQPTNLPTAPPFDELTEAEFEQRDIIVRKTPVAGEGDTDPVQFHGSADDAKPREQTGQAGGRPNSGNTGAGAYDPTTDLLILQATQGDGLGPLVNAAVHAAAQTTAMGTGAAAHPTASFMDECRRLLLPDCGALCGRIGRALQGAGRIVTSGLPDCGRQAPQQSCCSSLLSAASSGCEGFGGCLLDGLKCFKDILCCPCTTASYIANNCSCDGCNCCDCGGCECNCDCDCGDCC
ncbi:MAG TPA: hypothetical protein VLJ86_11565 [Ramlibacter sp.]|nr:hypothetical protein [Ramlibacter sp.]